MYFGSVLEQAHAHFEEEWRDVAFWQRELGYREQDKWTKAWPDLMRQFDARAEGWYERGGLLAGETSLDVERVARWYVDEYVPFLEIHERAAAVDAY